MSCQIFFYYVLLPFLISSGIIIDLHFSHKNRITPSLPKRTSLVFLVFFLSFILYYYKVPPLTGFDIFIIYLCLTRIDYKHVTFIFLISLIISSYLQQVLFPLYTILIMLSYYLFILKHKHSGARVMLMYVCSLVLLNLELFVMDVEVKEIIAINGLCMLFWGIISGFLLYYHGRQESPNLILQAKYYDHITKIPNYNSLLNDSYLLLKKKTKISLLLINIDRLKDINKLYGTDFGDRVLVEVASTLTTLVKDYGKVYRLSGDSFCVISMNENLQRMVTISEKIRLAIDIKELFYDNNKIKLAVSIGGYYGDTESKKIDDYLEIAQENLFDSKMAGRNRIVINNRMVFYS